MKNSDVLLERVYLEISNICNLRCSFCVGTKREKRVMTKDEVTRVLKSLAGKVGFVYLHVLGEPLLHPELDYILTTASELGMRACITTNGTLLDTRSEVLLRHADCIHKVSVSLHSPEGSGISDIDLYTASVCDFAKRAAEAGIFTVMRLWNLDSEIRSGKNTQNSRIKKIIEERLGSEWKRHRGGFRIGERIFIEYGEIFEWPAESTGDERSRLYCHALSSQAAILADGTVVPCCLDADGDMPLGNIFDMSLDEILGGERAVKIKDGFARREAVEPLCKRCTFARRFKV